MLGSLAMEARHTGILMFLGRSQYYRTTISGVRLTARECKRCICLWSKGVVSWNYPKCASEGTASENGKQLITSWISINHRCSTHSQSHPKWYPQVTSQGEFAGNQWPCLNLKIANDSGPGTAFAEWPVTAMVGQVKTCLNTRAGIVGYRLLLGAAKGLDMVGIPTVERVSCLVSILSQLHINHEISYQIIPFHSKCSSICWLVVFPI